MNKKTIVFILFSLITLFLLAFLALKTRPTTPPTVISVSPSPDEAGTSLLPEIAVMFDKTISPIDISFLTTPSFPYHLLSEDESTTVKYLPSQLLDKKTSYQISLKFKFGGEYSWSFTTGESEAGAVPGWKEGFQKAKEQYETQYPPEEVEILNNIKKQMPYFFSSFWIEYSPRTNKFTAHLCQQPYETTRGTVEDWFNSQGFQNLLKLKPRVEWLLGCEPPKIIPKITPIEE